MISSKPLVSVIIPVYNREHSILNSVNSVLSQDYESFEIIVVDDASTDNTASVISEINSGRTSIIRHEHNKGANAARNSGLKVAKGDWIAFLDSDDSWEPNKLSIMIESLLSKNDDYNIAYCSMSMFKDGEKIGQYSVVKSGDLFKDLLRKNIIGSASVPVIQKKALQNLVGFDEELQSAQDWDLWLRAAEKGYKFKAVPNQLVRYTLPTSKGHISNSLSSFINGRKAFINKHRNLYHNHNSALSYVYRDTAFLLLKRFNEKSMARKFFVQSFLKNPFQLKVYKGLIGTFLPIHFKESNFE